MPYYFIPNLLSGSENRKTKRKDNNISLKNVEEKSAKRSERDIEKESLRAEERESEVIWDGHNMI